MPTNSIKTELITSPMYNLSLSSKELFHSNFLAWLGSNPKTRGFLTDVVNGLVSGLNLSSSGNWTVEREDKHFDLCIKDDNDNYLLIIENKVKSIPLKRQLDKYVQKNVKGKDQKTKYLLLTLTEKFAHRTKIDKRHDPSNHWIVKTYKDLATVMQNKLHLVTNDTYLQSILTDYIGFIENLYLLVREWQNELFFAQDWNDISKLKDLHAKIQFSRYCEKLKQFYLSKLSDIVVYDDDFIPKTIDDSKVYVKVNWGYASWGQRGIFGIEIPVNCLDNPKIVTGFNTHNKGKRTTSPFSIKIQVEGLDFRHVIETNTDITDKPVDDELIIIGRGKPYTDHSTSGFNFFSEDPLNESLPIPVYGISGASGNNTIFDDQPKRLYPTSKKRIPDERWPFASYRDKKKHVQFIYQSRHIKENTTIEEVLENVLAEVTRILNFFPKVTTP